MRTLISVSRLKNVLSNFHSRNLITTCQLCKEELIYDVANNIGSEFSVTRNLRVAGMPHQVFVIQPYIKWGVKKVQNTTPQLQLEESVALVKTLPNWSVVETKIISLKSFDSKYIFGKGNLQTLTELITNKEEISAVFLNIQSLKLHQHLNLENVFKVPVFDRYSLIINIFKNHANTKEAKLQVALAEIPYIASRVQGINESESNFIKNIGIGSNETFREKRLRLLNEYEQKIKNELAILKKQRELLRSRRKEMKYPTVAIVGYTNAGKTSLIKSLTQNSNLIPEDKLFATLDVTIHEGVLPSNIKVLYVDTIGFISDVPTRLMEPFVATLEDALQADLIVHIQDTSHPDEKSQTERVLLTLKELNLPEKLAENIINVKNKCDKIEKFDSITENMDSVIYTSCRDGTGLEELKYKIEKMLYKTTDLVKLKVRVINGSDEYRWLHKEAAVSDSTPDSNNLQFIYLTVSISKVKLEKFKHKFLK